MPFKVGDKVRWLGKHIGIIRYFEVDNTESICYAVELGPNFRGHNCMGHISSMNGWWISGDSDLELLEPYVEKTKEQRIIDKIKYLDNKFAQRNKNHDYQTSSI